MVKRFGHKMIGWFLVRFLILPLSTLAITLKLFSPCLQKLKHCAFRRIMTHVGTMIIANKTAQKKFGKYGAWGDLEQILSYKDILNWLRSHRETGLPSVLTMQTLTTGHQSLIYAAVNNLVPFILHICRERRGHCPWRIFCHVEKFQIKKF